MQISDLTNLHRNDELIVAFGSKGRQRALFCRYGICQGESSLVVKKWRARSKSWTAPVHVLPGDVLERIKKPTSI